MLYLIKENRQLHRRCTNAHVIDLSFRHRKFLTIAIFWRTTAGGSPTKSISWNFLFIDDAARKRTGRACVRIGIYLRG